MRFLLFLLLFPLLPLFPESFSSFQQQNYTLHGNSLYRKAKDQCQKEYYQKCAGILREFILVYSEHPEKNAAMELLSQVYKKNGMYSKSIGIDTGIYLENPGTEAGLKAYFQAAMSYIKIGEMVEARYILEKIQAQDISRNLADQAALELKVLKIISAKSDPI